MRGVWSEILLYVSETWTMSKQMDTMQYNKKKLYSAKILRKPSSVAHQYQIVILMQSVILRQILIQIQFRIVNSDCGALRG